MIPFKNTYIQLSDKFFERVNPAPVSAPELLHINTALAEELGIKLPKDSSAASKEENARLAQIFSGNTLPEGAEPLAMAYAGHQFGHFVPQLGDGRAILLGEVTDIHGLQRDIQLKGAGRTRFSRSGDGRAALGPVIREYILSEAMHTMGVPTTRALAMVRTGDPVYRETPLPGAILTRVARSHIRVGTFEYFAARHDVEAIRSLTEYVIQRHYPHCAEAPNPYLAMLREIMRAQARLVARWLQLGFIHGVMNTDNTTVSGETIDYGPCAFMDDFQHNKVFSSIDQYSRYAYKNQPVVARWNLENLSACLAPILADTTEEAVELIKDAFTDFTETFEQSWRAGFLQKIGLWTDDGVDSTPQKSSTQPTESQHTGTVHQNQSEPQTMAKSSNIELVHQLLSLMQRHRADFTNTFRYLGDDDPHLSRFRAQFPNTDDINAWISDWSSAIDQMHTSQIDKTTQENKTGSNVVSAQSTPSEPVVPKTIRERMNRVNPAYIPRNHRVEEAIGAALHGDMGLTDALIDLVSDPFTEREAFASYSEPPRPEQVVHQTFCGT